MLRVVQRRDAPVDLGATAALTQITVHVKGKIQRRSACGQIDHLALGRHGVDPVLEQAAAEPGQFVRVGGAAVTLQQRADFLDLVVVTTVHAAFLVAPVRSHSQLRLVLHFAGADLHFQRPAIRPAYRRVDGAVVVVLGVAM